MEDNNLRISLTSARWSKDSANKDKPKDITIDEIYKELENIINAHSIGPKRRKMRKFRYAAVVIISAIAFVSQMLFHKPLPNKTRTRHDIVGHLQIHETGRASGMEYSKIPISELVEGKNRDFYALFKTGDTIEARMRLEKVEVYELRHAIERMLRYDGRHIYGSLTNKYLLEVISEARWSSEKLRIPFDFVLSDWLMECGKFSYVSAPNIMDNNLSNMGYEASDGFHLYSYNSLHSFSKDYVSTMEKADVEGINNYYKIALRMRAANFFVGESAENYFEKVLGVSLYLKKVRRTESRIDSCNISAAPRIIKQYSGRN